MSVCNSGQQRIKFDITDVTSFHWIEILNLSPFSCVTLDNLLNLSDLLLSLCKMVMAALTSQTKLMRVNIMTTALGSGT